ncbi:NADH-FMN oxidoreductase RutF, flavin reductase (DIM6/NTAB) family [Saccharopolyspora antimicrobica]|uniref:Flavin reductase (DIM6/NTAB) family NADH-FMN oxidoreductase RutF n=1 Tax=Saccharopolyspora antimicrobica TaxID=455193 RepID=A0A1I4RYP8_9PSEU|nr:flavin reductase family protein [Saccharopolyspora antimicrobica]RKT89201.1 flavin reductase (DIM6/NTAB) family NADH-FMN oxidoreductase RutF [Saccharopolyspora antimicrobica]SFM57422.1 NADH-FMN oxidoreductase RutF, flavin reductase (DIM6/NTAB) family [Saccharopolyspora antimicrobica]
MTPQPTAVDGEVFRQAMRRLPTGVAVLTTRGPHGMTINSALSVSLDPPLLLVAIGHRTRTHGLLAHAESFTVNVLGAGQRALAAHFAGRRAVGEFGGVDWHPSPVTGDPVLVGSPVSIDCRIDRQIEAADHTLFLGAVRHVHSTGANDPLVFADRDYRRLAKEPVR